MARSAAPKPVTRGRVLLVAGTRRRLLDGVLHATVRVLASDGGGGVFGDLARAVGQMKLIDKSLDGEEERLIIATCMADVKTIGSLLGKEGGSFVLDVPLLFSSVVGNPDITRLIHSQGEEERRRRVRRFARRLLGARVQLRPP
jgi:hypothetical protein